MLLSLVRLGYKLGEAREESAEILRLLEIERLGAPEPEVAGG